MWSDFSIKPIGKPSEGIPDAMPIQEPVIAPLVKPSSQARKTKQAAEVDFPITKERMQEPVSAKTEAENTEIINFDPDFLVKEIKDVLKSPSPFTLFKKSSELKDNFAKFINYLVKKIAIWFSSQDKTMIDRMYVNAKYENVWIANMKNYLEDSKYFDINLYFKTIVSFQKESQYQAKALLKIYKREPEKSVREFLKKYKSGFTYEEVLKNYAFLRIENLRWSIEPKYLDENKISRFLEQIYLLSESEGIFQIFNLSQDELRSKFSEVYSIFSYIARTYLKQVSYKDRQVMTYLRYSRNEEVMRKLDILMAEYIQNKTSFYKKVVKVISEKNETERWYFWSYVKTRIIDLHYKQVSRLFYWDEQACSNRSEWAALKWNFVFSEKSEYYTEIKEILSFKQLILELNSNLLAPFLKPFIYSIVSEKLAISRKELLKIRYLMTLILSENYLEYKKIYNFFEDIEAFMDYNIDSTFSEITINIKKFKIFAADILVWTIWLVWLYLYAPVWVFAWSFILSVSYLREHFKRFSAWVEWNLWIRSFATVMLIVSTFFWITNLNATKVDLAKLSSKVEKIWMYKTDETARIVIRKIDSSWIKKAVADILQSIKK
ncbi:MAG: hypothetical protein ACD_2C00131G0015 [uncultured bacterium (gcode 4)]|uniref:Uncharacterized protein n=1 Tax=uncultured bacterium (gcode 4) TaxID=1234023 RepID=K2H1F8_9BACT|nr:MAG: hypothetical protein ACD_2C00131G0015 [uncultured bacterium (gcode 4)]